jgi:hypothetical protein
MMSKLQESLKFNWTRLGYYYMYTSFLLYNYVNTIKVYYWIIVYYIIGLRNQHQNFGVKLKKVGVG